MARGDGNTESEPKAEAEPPEPAEEKSRLGRWLDGQRERRPWLDHAILAGERYTDRNGDHLAAAITYFSFLALFPVLLLAMSVAGFVLASRPDLVQELADVIEQNIPGGLGQTINEAVETAIDSRAAVGVFGLVVLLYSGLGWIGNLRIAMQEMWDQPPRKPSFVKDKVGDLLALGCLGVAALLSVGITAVVGALTDTVLDWTGPGDLPGAGVLTRVLGILIAVIADMVIFLWVLVNLSRRPITYRAVLRGALLGAIGFEILKYVGTIYLASVTSSPAAGVFGSVIGLLVWFNLASRFLLFTTAWTATSRSVHDAEEAARRAAAGEDVQRGAGSAPVRRPAPAVAPMARPDVGPSAPVILGALIGLGAVAGMLVPPAARRWWYAGKPPPRT